MSGELVMSEHELERLMVEIRGISRRLSVIESRQDQLRQEFAELRGGRKVAFIIFGACATIAGLVLAAWQTFWRQQ